MTTLDQAGGNKPPKNPVLDSKDKDALQAFGEECLGEATPEFFESHSVTEDLQYIAERYKRLRKGRSESNVRFELDPDGDQILVVVTDEVTGDFQIKMTPDEVADVLKNFETTSDNDSTLTSFFIDFEK